MKRRKLKDALDGLFAYDDGCTDSGIHDEALRARCITALAALSEDEVVTLTHEMWLSEQRLAEGYTTEDAVQFVQWLRDRMEVLIEEPRFVQEFAVSDEVLAQNWSDPGNWESR